MVSPAWFICYFYVGLLWSLTLWSDVPALFFGEKRYCASVLCDWIKLFEFTSGHYYCLFFFWKEKQLDLQTNLKFRSCCYIFTSFEHYLLKPSLWTQLLFNSWSVLIFIYLAFYEQGRSFSIRIWRKYGILFYLIHQTCLQTRIEWDQKWSTNQISFDVRTTIIRTVYQHYVQTNQAFFKLLVLFFLFFFWRLLFKIFPLAIFFVPSLNFFLHITIFVKSSSLTFSVTHLYWFALISFGLTHFLIH